MTTLLWEECWEKRTSRSRRRYLVQVNLYAGSATFPIARLRRSQGERYELWSDLPVRMRLKYLPLEEARADAERSVRAYLASVQSDDLHELSDGAGI